MADRFKLSTIYDEQQGYYIDFTHDDQRVTLYNIEEEGIINAHEERHERVGNTITRVNDVTTLDYDTDASGWDWLDNLERHPEDYAALRIGSLAGIRKDAFMTVLEAVVEDTNRVTMEDVRGGALVTEREGVELEVAVRVFRTMRDEERVETVCSNLLEMSYEEYCYWNAKARSPRQQSGAKALRTLLLAPEQTV